MLMASRRTVVCWAMGMTRHRHAVGQIASAASTNSAVSSSRLMLRLCAGTDKLNLQLAGPGAAR